MKTKWIALSLFVVACASVGWTFAPVESRQDALRAPVVPVAVGPTWDADLSRARERAEASGKPVLVWFSGHGWNAASAQLGTVVSHPTFVKGASERCVLANVNFANSVSSDESSAAAHSAWAYRLGVRELPALVLLAPGGRPIASLSARSDVASQRAELDRAIGVEAALDRCLSHVTRASTDLERAQWLDQSLELVRPYAADWYADLGERLLAISGDDGVARLKLKWQAELSESAIDRVVQREVYPLADAGQFTRAAERVDVMLARDARTTAQRQLLMALKGQLLYSNKDRAAALATLNDALSLDPDSTEAVRVRVAIDQIAHHDPAQ